MARFWIVNPYEPLPQEGLLKLRYSRLCETLAGRGHDVTWWSVNWAHDRKERRDASVGTEPFCLRVLEVPAYRKNISLGRIRSHQAYARKFQVMGEQAAGSEGSPDLIVFSVPPMETGKVALNLGRRHGAKVVLDVMDAWPDILIRTLATSDVFRWLARLLAIPYENAMRRYCRQCDAVCAQSETFAEFAISKGAASKPSVFYLGADRPSKRKTRDINGTQKGKIELTYVGSMGTFYDLRTVVLAFIKLGEQKMNCHLTLIGEGEQRLALQRLAKSSPVADRIRFSGYLQGEKYEEIIGSGDIGLIPMLPSSGVAVPYKAGEYLGRGMFVINSLPGELQRLLVDMGCGISYEAGNVGSLTEAMRHAIGLIEGDKGLLVSESARQLFDEKFDRKNISSQFADWLETLIA